jgi:hypothetical protein
MTSHKNLYLLQGEWFLFQWQWYRKQEITWGSSYSSNCCNIELVTVRHQQFIHTCKIIENCMTRGCSRLDSCCCLCSPVCGAWIEQPKCRGECRAMNSNSSAVVPRLILLAVRVTRNSLQNSDISFSFHSLIHSFIHSLSRQFEGNFPYWSLGWSSITLAFGSTSALLESTWGSTE